MPNRSTNDRRLYIAAIVIGCIGCFLLLLLLVGGLRSEEDIRAIAREETESIASQMSLQNGDTYDIQIEAQGSSDLFAASRGLLSAVSVQADFPVRANFGYTRTATFSGAGVIYELDKTTGDAYVLTNYHVIYNAASLTEDGVSDTIRLYLFGSERDEDAIEATFLGGSPYYDLALLRVKNSNLLRTSAAIAATFAPTDSVSVLDTAIAIGNPTSGGISATAGHVSVVSETIRMPIVTNEAQGVDMRVMRIDTPVNSGNSGGGLYNSRGELIGIVNAKYNASSVENIAYAIPASIVQSIAQNILHYCDGEQTTRVYRCMLGISLSAVDSRAVYDETTGKVSVEQTVAVSAVQEGAPADGVLLVGDVVKAVTLHGQTLRVTQTHHLIDLLLNARVGDTVALSIERDGAPLTVTFSVTEAYLTAY